MYLTRFKINSFLHFWFHIAQYRLQCKYKINILWSFQINLFSVKPLLATIFNKLCLVNLLFLLDICSIRYPKNLQPISNPICCHTMYRKYLIFIFVFVIKVVKGLMACLRRRNLASNCTWDTFSMLNSLIF